MNETVRGVRSCEKGRERWQKNRIKEGGRTEEEKVREKDKVCRKREGGEEEGRERGDRERQTDRERLRLFPSHGKE